MELLAALEQEFGGSWAQNIIRADDESTLETPANLRARSHQVVSWSQVKAFVDMAEEALKAKSAAHARISSQLESVTAKMAQANEEQEFLKEQIESLIADRTTQQQKFQELVRQNHSLAAELNILRAHLAGQETVESPSTSSTDFAVMKLDFHQSETFGVAPLLTLRREHRVSPGASQSEFSGNSELPNLPNQTMTNQQHDQGNTTGSPSSHDQWGKHSFMRSAENTLTSEHETESTNSITQKP